MTGNGDDRCGVVEGEDLTPFLAAVDKANQLTRWTDGTTGDRALVVRPLPGEPIRAADRLAVVGRRLGLLDRVIRRALGVASLRVRRGQVLAVGLGRVVGPGTRLRICGIDGPPASLRPDDHRAPRAITGVCRPHRACCGHSSRTGHRTGSATFVPTPGADPGRCQ